MVTEIIFKLIEAYFSNADIKLTPQTTYPWTKTLMWKLIINLSSNIIFNAQ